MTEPRLVEHHEPSLEVLEKPRSLETDARWISHEGLRHLLKERHLEGTGEDLEAIRAQAVSEEYRQSKEGLAAAAFEESLRHNPLRFIAPNKIDYQEKIAEFFAEKVVREMAYSSRPEEYQAVARAARGVVSPDWSLKTILEKDLKTSEEFRNAAREAEVLWALGLERSSAAFSTEGPLNRKGLELVARLSLRAKGETVTREGIDAFVGEKLREHADALSFWRGYLESLAERGSDRKEKFDAALAAPEIGLTVDGTSGYKNAEELKRERPMGDAENYKLGHIEARRLYEEQYGAPKKIETAALAVVNAAEDFENEELLQKAELRVAELTVRRGKLFEKIQEQKQELSGFGGLVRGLLNSERKAQLGRDQESYKLLSAELLKAREELEKLTRVPEKSKVN